MAIARTQLPQPPRHRPPATSKLRARALLAAAALALSAAAPAGAASLQLWNGTAWVDTGLVRFQGPVLLRYGAIQQYGCSADLAVSVSAGVATATALAFGGNQPCPQFSGQNLPWPVVPAPYYYSGPNPPFTGAPLLAPPLFAVQIAAVRLQFVPSWFAFCPSSTGASTLNTVMESSGRIVFQQAMGPCLFQTQSGYGLVPTVPVRVLP